MLWKMLFVLSGLGMVVGGGVSGWQAATLPTATAVVEREPVCSGGPADPVCRVVLTAGGIDADVVVPSEVHKGHRVTVLVDAGRVPGAGRIVYGGRVRNGVLAVVLVPVGLLMVLAVILRKPWSDETPPAAAAPSL